MVEWDPAKAVSNRRKHGVDFREALTALEDPLSTAYPDPEHSLEERRFVTIGIGQGPHLRTFAACPGCSTGDSGSV
jgi:hypothetical protein